MIPVVVVDASVALKWTVTEESSEQANALIDNLASGAIALAAPDHLIGEVANGLRKRVSQGILNTDDAVAALEIIGELELEFFGGTDRWLRTLRAAMDWQITTYDALYVLLALDLDAELVTSDHRLADSAREKSLPVRSLTTYVAPDDSA
jgi:predicted nucleic acid-binding protein